MVERLTLAAGPATRLATRLAAPLLLLAGCGSDNSVADPPPLSPPTSYPTHAPQRESPEHFIRRWAQVERQMENTGHTAVYLSLSTGCRACRVLAHTVAQSYAHGGYIHWGGWHIRSIRVYPPRADSVSLEVHSISAPTTYKTASGRRELHLDGGPITYLLTLTPRSGPFHVSAKAQVGQR
jgi:hypothetical protein